jgi:hypothetical protein
MSFLGHLSNFEHRWNPITRADPIGKSIGASLLPKHAPAPPEVPNQNDASNAAQSLTDSMRQRRGLMANIYAGSLQGASSAPVTGKTQLGT